MPDIAHRAADDRGPGKRDSRRRASEVPSDRFTYISAIFSLIV